MNRLLTLLALEPQDRRALLVLGPLFALTTAASVVVASASRAIFLAAWPLDLLPWSFMSTGLATALVSLLYVSAMRRFALRARLLSLIVTTALVCIALAATFSLAPGALSWAIVIACPALGHLIAVQAWNLAAAALPTRDAKRLVPVLAGLATLGGAVGGGAVPLLVPWISAVDLLYLAAAFLVWPAFSTPRLLASLEPANEEAPASPDAPGASWLTGARDILSSPILVRLALFLFFLQLTSVLLDYQFSGELKAHFSRESMASFLGIYYWIANSAIFAFALLGTGRLVRGVGIGLTISGASLLVLAGSVVYFALGLGGGELGGAAFWVMMALAFSERVGQYALVRSGTQLLVSPLDARIVERSRTLLDGVVYRLATALAALALLLLAPAAAALHWLSIAVVAGSAVVISIGVSVGPHYRAALFRALRAAGHDSGLGRYFQRTLGAHAEGELRARLQSADPEDRLQALEAIRDLGLTLEARTILPLLFDPAPRLATTALRTANAMNIEIDALSWRSLLDPGRPVDVLREALVLLSHRRRVDLDEAVSRLTAHADPRVAALAGSLAVLRDPDAQEDRTLEGFVHRTQPHLNISSLQYVAQLTAMVHAPSQELRRDAVEAMGQLRLADHVEPLARCLDRPELRPLAAEALRKYDQDAAPRFSAVLADPSLSLTSRLGLIRVIEQRRDGLALELLTAQADHPSAAVRSAAILALWRLTDVADLIADRQRLRAIARDEIGRLSMHDRLYQLVGQGRGPEAFLREELHILREAAEDRIFRLLAMIYDRDAIDRAHLTCRSVNVRTRSNAIELLDQHLVDAGLKPFVALIERRGRRSGLQPMRPAGGEGEAERWLGGHEPWLHRVWGWVRRAATADGVAVDVHHPVGRIYWLKTIPLFDGVGGEDLEGVAAAIEPRTYEEGGIICHQGEPGDSMYAVLAGRVEIRRGEARLATMIDGDYFGEVALLDRAPRSATAVATETTTLLVVPRDVFLNLLEFHPGFAMRIIRVLNGRLRASVAQKPRAQREG